MKKEPVQIRRATRRDIPEWLRLRQRLWPGNDDEENWPGELRGILSSRRWEAFVAVAQGGNLVGFLEAHLREYAEGCSTSPVGFIEGWYVEEEYRRLGIGGALVQAAERWAIARGCTEMASDALLENNLSRRCHQALGYEEVERQVCFRKPLRRRQNTKDRRDAGAT
jgi:aminoglycoside 6'-N-acetyltransferase I